MTLFQGYLLSLIKICCISPTIAVCADAKFRHFPSERGYEIICVKGASQKPCYQLALSLQNTYVNI